MMSSTEHGTSTEDEIGGVPIVDLSDVEVLRDPFRAYGHARERWPLARIQAPGFGPIWALTRHEEARAMLVDPRFVHGGASGAPPSPPAGERLSPPRSRTSWPAPRPSSRTGGPNPATT